MADSRYGVLVFQQRGGFYSFWGEESLYKAMVAGVQKDGINPMYGISDVSPKDLDRVADSAVEVVKKINGGQNFDALKELRKYHVDWNIVAK
jgi:hypothetical protein